MVKGILHSLHVAESSHQKPRSSPLVFEVVTTFTRIVSSASAYSSPCVPDVVPLSCTEMPEKIETSTGQSVPPERLSSMPTPAPHFPNPFPVVWNAQSIAPPVPPTSP